MRYEVKAARGQVLERVHQIMDSRKVDFRDALKFVEFESPSTYALAMEEYQIPSDEGPPVQSVADPSPNARHNVLRFTEDVLAAGRAPNFAAALEVVRREHPGIFQVFSEAYRPAPRFVEL